MCSLMVVSVGVAITPPLKLPIGVVIPSDSSSIRMPRGGRLLIIVKIIPAARSSATAAWARAVKTLASVTKVPSTSETTAEIFTERIRGDAVMSIFQREPS
jgi:hypothetical protein